MAVAEIAEIKRASAKSQFIPRLVRSKISLVALGVVLLVAIAAIFAPSVLCRSCSVTLSLTNLNDPPPMKQCGKLDS